MPTYRGLLGGVWSNLTLGTLDLPPILGGGQPIRVPEAAIDMEKMLAKPPTSHHVRTHVTRARIAFTRGHHITFCARTTPHVSRASISCRHHAVIKVGKQAPYLYRR